MIHFKQKCKIIVPEGIQPFPMVFKDDKLATPLEDVNAIDGS